MDKCKISVFPSCEDYSEIILSIVLFVIFIVIFYFTYGLYMERKVLDKELTHIIDSLKSTTIFMDPNTKNYLKFLLQNVKIQDNSDEDAAIESHNNKIMEKLYIAIPILFVFGIGMSYFLSTKWAAKLFGGHCGTFNYRNVLLKNIIVIIMIALIEFIFITYYASEYISIDTQQVISLFLNKLIEYRDVDSKKY